MFCSKKPDPNPRGVRLGDLAAMLGATTIKPTLKDNALIAEHEQYTVRVDVLPPTVKDTDVGPISAVVKLPSICRSRYLHYLKTILQLQLPCVTDSPLSGLFIKKAMY